MPWAIGFRVPRGTQFRQWATERLGEYLVKGFTLDDERLKGGGGLVDYFRAWGLFIINPAFNMGSRSAHVETRVEQGRRFQPCWCQP